MMEADPTPWPGASSSSPSSRAARVVAGPGRGGGGGVRPRDYPRGQVTRRECRAVTRRDTEGDRS